MMKAGQTLSRALPACPTCKKSDAVRAMTATPGQYFCARCQLNLSLETEAKDLHRARDRKGEYLTKGEK